MANNIAFPSTLMNQNERDFVRLKFFNHQWNSSGEKQEDYDFLFLPLSKEAFKVFINADHSEEEMGVLNTSVMHSFQEHGGTISGLQKVMKEGWDNLTLKNAGTFGDRVIGKGLTTADNTVVKGVVYKKGIAYNPNMQIMFNGESQGYREFNFNWKFFPRTENELKNIEKLENILKKHTLPNQVGLIDDSDAIVTNLWEYPSKVQVRLYVDGKIDNSPFQILHDTVIRNLDFNYSNQEVPKFIKHETSSSSLYSPINVDVTLLLREIKVYTRDDVESEYTL